MGWSDWYECSFDDKGELDIRPLVDKAPTSPGIYAIAMKDGYGYQVQYIGMSTTNIYKRLRAHFTGRGNNYIKERLKQKKEQHRTMELVNALYFMYLETSKEDTNWMESLYIRGTMPIANVQQRLSLPRPLQDLSSNFEVERED